MEKVGKEMYKKSGSWALLIMICQQSKRNGRVFGFRSRSAEHNVTMLGDRIKDTYIHSVTHEGSLAHCGSHYRQH